MKFKSISLLLLIIVFITACENNSTKNISENQTTEVTKEKKEPKKPEETEIWKPVPPKINFNESGVPSDAIVLFDGTNFDEWISSRDSTDVKWNLNEDASMTVKDKTGDIQTKRNFGSIQLHIEWRSDPNNTQTNQNKSNSGVFLQNRYEIQVLDNNNNSTYVNGQVASIYKQSIPLAMASVETGKWNSYDIIYHAPQFNKDGEKTKSGTITVLHNGVLVQDHFEIKGTTEYIGWPKNKAHGKAPIKLQDHQDNSGVSYRNIWVRDLE